MNDKMAKITKYYTSYFCGMLDALVELKNAVSASDVQNPIKEAIEDIAREAYLAGQEEKK